MLSHAGRLTLIKSVFASLPIYSMSNIMLNKSTINKLTSIIRKFWWTHINKDNDSKPIYFRAWDDNCKPMLWPKHNCIRDLYTMNKSIVSTMAWRIIKNPTSLLTRILRAKYFQNSSIWNLALKFLSLPHDPLL